MELQTALNEFVRSEGQHGLAQLFSLRHDFPNAWHAFLNPAAGSQGNPTLTMELEGRFPFFLQHKTITIDALELFVDVERESSGDYNVSTLKLSLEAGTAESINPLPLVAWKGLLRGSVAPIGLSGDWTLTGWLDAGGEPNERLNPGSLKDIVVVCRYAVS
ncbi:MAG: hypothetical protein GY937_21735 [bacterium]|nr:hypothetical protein [bacterium]